MQISPLPDRLNFNYLKKLHRFLFSDVYPWAGKTRADLGLSGTIRKEDSKFFCMSEKIDDKQKRIFREFKQLDELARCVKPEGFADGLAKLWNDLNYLHPFVEGNGRTTRLFINEICRRVGIQFDACLLPKDRFVDAADQYLGSQNNMPLIRLIYEDLASYCNEQVFNERIETINKGRPLIITSLKPNWQEEFFVRTNNLSPDFIRKKELYELQNKRN